MRGSPSNSSEQREWRAARSRLLSGYAPLTIFILALALVTLFIPSVAPEKSVTMIREGLQSTSSSSGTKQNSTGPGTTIPGQGSVATTPGNGGGVGTSGLSQVPGTSVSARSGGGAAVTGDTTICENQTLQIPGDPYSPPCIAFSGSNGGATSPGVSASTITLSYRIPADFASLNQSIGSLGGAQYTASVADTERTVQGLVTYFNHHFQFYGRKLNVVFYNGQGSVTTEVEGDGQAQATADATTVAQQIHAFADIDAQSPLYTQALSQQHVVNIGLPDSATATMESQAPYDWGTATSCDALVSAGMEVVDKELANRAASAAGGSLKGQTRKFAIIAPDNPNYQTCANEAIALAKQAGVTITDDLEYSLNINTVAAQDDNIIAKLANDQITTVILLTDPVSPIFLTERAAQQSYAPEWFVMGAGGDDTDPEGQAYDQGEWSHAFGVSFNGATVAEQSTLGYAAYKSVNNDEPAAVVVNPMYENLDILAIGLEMAGPDLTPTTFEQGMRAYPGSQTGNPNLQFGSWLFPTNVFNPVQDSWLISWDPNQTSIYNGSAGAYDVDSARYRSGQYPSGAPSFPSGFPMTPAGS